MNEGLKDLKKNALTDEQVEQVSGGKKPPKKSRDCTSLSEELDNFYKESAKSDDSRAVSRVSRRY